MFTCSDFCSFNTGRGKVLKGELLNKRMFKLAVLRGCFTRTDKTTVSENDSSFLHCSADLSRSSLSPSPPPTTTATEELMQRDPIPQVPLRNRTPQTQEISKPSDQPEAQPVLSARRISKPPREFINIYDQQQSVEVFWFEPQRESCISVNLLNVIS